MTKLISLLLLTPLLALSQSAQYPNALATDSNLKVAKNRTQTVLSASVAATDTSIVVLSNTGFVANMLINIDNEIMNVCGVSGTNTINIGVSSCPNIDGRGLDGSTAATHSTRATSLTQCSPNNTVFTGCVSAYIDALHHNALKAEVEAIEVALGTNLSNIPTGPLVSSANYNFAAQAPGGSLVVGNNTITMVPVPKGTNGTDTLHYLFVSGGVGTAEPCLITGGTGIAGQASGQIIINCANTHSGAWTIASDTGGIFEAQNASPAGSVITIPSGTYTMHHSMTISKVIWLQGNGMPQLFLGSGSNSAMVIFSGVNGQGCGMSGVELNGNKAGNPTVGGDGAFGVTLSASSFCEISENYIHDNAGSAIDGITAVGNRVVRNRIENSNAYGVRFTNASSTNLIEENRLNNNAFGVQLYAGESTFTITNCTNATPIVCTATSSAYANGNVVEISMVLGNLAANGVWTLSGVSGTSFALVGSVGSGAYTGGGSVTRNFNPQNKIRGNWILNSTGTNVQIDAGISVAQSPDTEISGNHVIGNVAIRGILIFDNALRSVAIGNAVIGNGTTGSLCGFDAGPSDQLKIIGNHISANGGCGLYLADAIGWVVQGNEIISNGKAGGALPSQNGITIQHATGLANTTNGNVIAGNVITDPAPTQTQRYGICEDCNGATGAANYVRNVYTGNYLTGNLLGPSIYVGTSNTVWNANGADSDGRLAVAGRLAVGANIVGAGLSVGDTNTLYVQDLTNPKLKVGTGFNGANDDGVTISYNETSHFAAIDSLEPFGGIRQLRLNPSGGPVVSFGPFKSGGTAVTITSGFGTAPSIAGFDGAFRVTLGNPVGTTGVVALKDTWSTAPVVTCNDETTNATVRATPTITQVTLTQLSGTWVAGDVISCVAVGY